MITSKQKKIENRKIKIVKKTVQLAIENLSKCKNHGVSQNKIGGSYQKRLR